MVRTISAFLIESLADVREVLIGVYEILGAVVVHPIIAKPNRIAARIAVATQRVSNIPLSLVFILEEGLP